MKQFLFIIMLICLLSSCVTKKNVDQNNNEVFEILEIMEDE